MSFWLKERYTSSAFRRWQLLAQRKMNEMDDLIAKAKNMNRLLEKADRCKCLDLEGCGRAILGNVNGNEVGASQLGGARVSSRSYEE